MALDERMTPKRGEQCFVVNCRFISTSVNLRLWAKTPDDALEAAYRNPIGKKAEHRSVIGVRPSK